MRKRGGSRRIGQKRKKRLTGFCPTKVHTGDLRNCARGLKTHSLEYNISVCNRVDTR